MPINNQYVLPAVETPIFIPHVNEYIKLIVLVAIN